MKKSETAELKRPNQPDVSGFDYMKLEGQSLVDYLAIVNQLPADNEYLFDQFKASPVLGWEVDRRTGDKHQVLDAIRLVSTIPINTTQIPAKYARDLNNQIVAGHGDNNSRYFLLHKEVNRVI